MFDEIDVERIFEYFIRSIKENKRILAGFESRINNLLFIKRRFRKIFHLINFPESYEEVISIISELIEKLNQYQDVLDFSLKTKDLKDCDDEIKNSIYENLDGLHKLLAEQKEIKFHSLKRRIEKLRKIVGAEKNEDEIILEFNKRINDFNGVILSQKEKIKKSIELLEKIKERITQSINEDDKKITDSEIKEWRHFIKNYRKEIERLVKVEKDMIHDPLSDVLRKTLRTKKLVQKLKKKDEISKEDILKDIETFSRADEFSTYISAINRLKVLEGNEKREEIEDYLARRLEVVGEKGRNQHYQINWLNKLAFFDQLTEIHNRRSLIKGYKRFQKKNKNLDKVNYCMIFFDIDNFKGFNSEYGHEIGDKVLKKVASIANKTMKKMIPKQHPEDPICARWGGEEFVVFLPEFSKDQGIETAEEIRKEIEHQSQEDFMKKINDRIKIQNPIYQVTISSGIAFSDETKTRDIEEITALANQRMNFAKRNGKNKVILS